MKRQLTTMLTVLSISYAFVLSAMADRGADFNGDGYDDLVIGAIGESSNSAANLYGMVHIIYGTPNGIQAAGSQTWHQNSAGIPGEIQDTELFGASLAWGDFDNDGFDDLAVGVTRDLGAEGSVHVLYGSETGLTSTGNQFFTQDTPGLEGAPRVNGGFGARLVAADFDGDSFDDLVIAAHDLHGANRPAYGSGMIHVLFGSASGLTADTAQYWHADIEGLEGQSEDGFEIANGDNVSEYEEFFGVSIAAGDFNNDGFADLVVGVSEIQEQIVHGAVNILYGSPDGLTLVGNQLFDQDSAGIPNSPEMLDRFGVSTAAGDLNGDGYDDLAIGAPGESSGNIQHHGIVHILYGGDSGLTSINTQVWHQDTPGLVGTRENNDRFGASLSSADFDGDGFFDLAIGCPGEDLSGKSDVGSVVVIYGSSAGLTAARNHNLKQSELGDGDQFGAELAVGDYNGDGRTDLAVGAPLEDLPGAVDAGIVNTFRGRAGGLKRVAWQNWHQNSPNIANIAHSQDWFGSLR